MDKLTSFTRSGSPVPVRYVETQTVKAGVECDIYTFKDNTSKDLAIVRVTKGYKTPLQRVLKGQETIEGYLEGIGTLTVESKNGKREQHRFNSSQKTSDHEIIVGTGQKMQWYADSNEDLVFYEICWPPYKDGRFEDLEDK